ncbi:MAG TPA: hypothetical protein VL500_02875 [Candidatus Eisenbacteria bacterium]|jgi:hypothetical protein|nr:hypothetical protein [Candidatus Eisenbacteria bacterium]
MHQHPHHIYYYWGLAGIAVVIASLSTILLPPAPSGNAQGLSRLVAVDTNVTPLGEIPNIGPGDASINGQTLVQQCKAGVPQQYWGICCVPPNYAASDACQNAMKKETPPANDANAGQDDHFKPEDVKLLPVAMQKEFARINAQIEKYEQDAEKIQAEIEQTGACELSCPGGAGAIQCTEENISVCVEHDKCIRACDKNFPQLKKKIDRLQKTEAQLNKKISAFQKKAEAYKLKNKRKFRAVDGATRK